jgi:exopolyphosphatase/guanosine-5'-triphosphate,3'-diphosphate pyrophosphatase
VNRPAERLAAIDVGSNTVLLTIADFARDTGLTVVEEAEDQPRLGAGIAGGRLSEAAMARALLALTRMRDTCRRLGVHRTAAVATAAVREASNGPEFVERVRAHDIPLRIISSDIEAALSYRSAAYRFPADEPTLVADIGGGSLELVGAADGHAWRSESLPLGAVRLTELAISGRQLHAHIRGVLERAMAPEWRHARIIGSGGTFATLAAMVVAHRGSSASHIHGTTIPAAEVADLLDTLSGLTPQQRRQTPGLKPERADIIVAGLAVVTELLAMVEAGGVTVSGFGLRDGLLLEMVGLQ